MGPRTDPTTTQKLSGVFIGEGSLTIECAEAFRRAGHEVRCVVAADAKIGQWAGDLNLCHIRPDDDVAAALADKPFDVLFSVVNLSIVPPAIFKLPRRIAINFHDALLPKYAGLYATSWALINQETQHGVTWHEMLPEVDAGRLLKQKSFAISANETAYSLNTKCFEAGIQSFEELLRDIETGAPSYADPRLQDRTYFPRSKRPQAGGLIVWDRAAEEISALVRALDFGPYANPLTRAKLAVGGKVFAVSKAEVTSSRSGSAAGTVVAIQAEAILVSTATNDISLAGFETLAGAPLPVAELGLQPGDLLPGLDQASIESLTETASGLARHEGFWTGRLLALESLTLPLANVAASNAQPVYDRVPLSLNLAGLASLDASSAVGETLAAAFACYLARLAATPAFTLGFGHTELRTRFGNSKILLAEQVPFGVTVDSEASAAENLHNLSKRLRTAKSHETYACDLISREPALRSALSSAAPFFALAVELVDRIEDFAPYAGSQLTLVSTPDGSEAAWYFDRNVFNPERIATMQEQFGVFLAAMLRDGETRLADLPILSEAERLKLQAWNQTAVDVSGPGCINELFEAQVKLTPNAPALAFRDQVLSYSELNCKANRLARRLMALGVGPEQLVGISTDRSTDMVVAMLAVLKSGGGYVPLDPAYPADRLRFIVQDSGIEVLLTQTYLAGQIDAPGVEIVLLDVESGEPYPETNPRSGVGPTNVAYTIYTSGSTGRPKGVVLEHRTVVNFFAGMDAKLEHETPGVWLAVTSPSFDISVLELLWTLCRGFKVVLYEREEIAAVAAAQPLVRRKLDFSLFYFGSHESADENDLYGFIMESARFADDHGWVAVWTPERHFHDFGGAFPNPSVLGAALAMNTKNVAIRAGSCVLPLHSPIRVAEEWSVVDNISHGRVGVSFAAGWQPNDFVLRPENYADAKNVMTRDIDVVRRLWRGETVAFPGHDGSPVDISILPRPVQPELPFWLTSAGSPQTFALAGTMGASILTHLLGQSFDEVASKVQVYRDAWKAAGHPGEGHVTLMLHTFVGEDDAAVKDAVRGPMKAYLASSVSLIKDVAWAFPTFQNRLNGGETFEASLAALSEDDMDALLEQAFNRYFETSGLFGRPERCLQTLEKVASIGVDEVACMADFGLSPAEIMQGLQKLEAVRQTWNAQVKAAKPAEPVRQAWPAASVSDLILQHGATHMQCTPSMASALLQDSTAGLSDLKQMLVGGEALPTPLASDLLRVLDGELINMYGPTETTIWSTCHVVSESDDPVSIGGPIANTQVYVLDPARKQVPIGAIGELYIGGDGVARGYLGRPELTAERFVVDPFSGQDGARMYRTGDLVRHLPDGDLEFLGRTDFQVKIRGHRIELGEIEGQLLSHPAIREVVVVAKEVSAGDQRLVAYWSALAATVPSADELRGYCRDRLPDYMVPHHFVKVAALPQTPNGKIDRNALPDFTTEVEAEPAAEVKPEGDLEETIAGIWKDVLKAPSVSVTTNFFDLGGHSLLALQMHRRLVEAVQPSLLLTDIFRFPTIRAMTEFIAAKDGGSEEEGRAAAQRGSLRREALSQRLRRRG